MPVCVTRREAKQAGWKQYDTRAECESDIVQDMVFVYEQKNGSEIMVDLGYIRDNFEAVAVDSFEDNNHQGFASAFTDALEKAHLSQENFKEKFVLDYGDTHVYQYGIYFLVVEPGYSTLYRDNANAKDISAIVEQFGIPEQVIMSMDQKLHMSYDHASSDSFSVLSWFTPEDELINKGWETLKKSLDLIDKEEPKTLGPLLKKFGYRVHPDYWIPSFDEIPVDRCHSSGFLMIDDLKDKPMDDDQVRKFEHYMTTPKFSAGSGVEPEFNKQYFGEPPIHDDVACKAMAEYEQLANERDVAMYEQIPAPSGEMINGRRLNTPNLPMVSAFSIAQKYGTSWDKMQKHRRCLKDTKVNKD